MLSHGQTTRVFETFPALPVSRTLTGAVSRGTADCRTVNQLLVSETGFPHIGCPYNGTPMLTLVVESSTDSGRIAAFRCIWDANRIPNVTGAAICGLWDRIIPFSIEQHEPLMEQNVASRCALCLNCASLDGFRTPYWSFAATSPRGPKAGQILLLSAMPMPAFAPALIAFNCREKGEVA